MALPPTATLVELRDQVLLRCGYSNDGNQAAAVTPMVNALIAGAERELFPECQWIRAMARITVDLADGDHVIDWPDDCEPGEIKNVWVSRSDTDAISELLPGVMINERDSADRGDTGRPVLYEYMERQIYLKPASSADYDALVITYTRNPSLVQESDTCLVDPELLIQRSVMKFKEYLGLPIGQLEAANHERYLARLRANNSNRSGLMIGGHKSWRTGVQRRNRVAQDGRSGSGASYTSEWNPW